MGDVIELILVGNFSFEPRMTIEQEIKRLKEKDASGTSNWSPTTQDFKALTGDKAVVCSSFFEMLSIINKQPDASIAMIKTFTHSGRGLIGMFGVVRYDADDKVEVVFRQMRGEARTSIDSGNMDWLDTQGAKFTFDGKTFTLADLRKKFITNAGMYFYSCNSGSDEKLLQSISDSLQVWVTGFKPRIAFCPAFNEKAKSITRKRVAFGQCPDVPFVNLFDLTQSAINTGICITTTPQSTHLP